MIIKYYSYTKDRICEEDLSNEQITEWWIGVDNSLNTNIKYLSILWNQTKLTRFGLGSVGIYPPLSHILNCKEVIEYLEKKHSKLKRNEQ